MRVRPPIVIAAKTSTPTPTYLQPSHPFKLVLKPPTEIEPCPNDEEVKQSMYSSGPRECLLLSSLDNAMGRDLITQLRLTGSSPSCHRCNKSIKQWSYTTPPPWAWVHRKEINEALREDWSTPHLPRSEHGQLQVWIAPHDSHSGFLSLEMVRKLREILVHHSSRPLGRIECKLTAQDSDYLLKAKKRQTIYHRK